MPWLLLIVLIDGIGFGIILPLLPVFAINFNLSAFHLGILVSSFSFFQLLLAPVLGALSDRFGRKYIIIICLFCMGLSYFILAYANSFTELLLARIFAGIFTGNVSVVLASAADLSTKENRGQYMGYIGGASGIGFILGPIISGLLAGKDTHTANFTLIFNAAASFTIIASILALFFLKESRCSSHDEECEFNTTPLLDRLKQTLKDIINNKGILYLVVLSVLMWLSFSAIYVFLTSWSVIRFDLSPRQVSVIAATFAFFTAIVQVISPKFITGGKAIFIGFQMSAFAIFAVLFNPNLVFLSIILVFLATGIGILFPNLNSTISLQGSNSQRGFVLGLSQSAGMLGQTLGPIIVGFVYSRFSPDYAWSIIGMSFFIASIITVKYMLDNKEI